MSFHHVRRLALLAALGALAACGSSGGSGAQQAIDPAVRAFVQDVRVIEKNDHVLVLDTEKGMIAIELRTTKAPITAQAIEALAAKKFYDGLTFHRVEKNFLVQTGDPSGGTGAPSGAKKIPLEINADLTNGIKGAVGMARPEDDRNGADSQFYILLAPKPSLDGTYAVFGQVVKGMDVAEKIEQGDRIRTAVVVQGLPEQPKSPAPAAQ
jgi:peptidylprolyl isomerase